MKGSRLVSRRINSTKKENKTSTTNPPIISPIKKSNSPTTSNTNATPTTSVTFTTKTTTKTTISPTKAFNNSIVATNSANSDQICNICAQNVPGPERERIFAFGKCDHHVCYVCSVRLRVVCEQSECPICREKLEFVLFTSYKNKQFDKHNLKSYIFNEKYKIYFENETIKEAFENLLKFECQECKKANIKQQANSSSQQLATKNSNQNINNNNDTSSNNNIKSNKNNKIEEDAQGLLETSSQVNETKFADVFGLKNHLNYVHKLKLCDLCLTHNKLFPFEYSYYTKIALKKHTEIGEPNTSHRGHPDCALCHHTFFNNEEMLLHMSREHYHCHLCGRQDSNMRIYFLDYLTLREHFKSKHILCERDNCRHEQFTSVFDNEIDFHLHLVQFHPTQTAGLSRGEVRHQRTITLEQPAYRGAGAHSNNSNNNNTIHRGNLPPNTAIVSTGPIATANNPRQQRAPESIQAQIRQQRLPTRAEFPALGQTTITPSSQAVTISQINPFPSLPTSTANNNNSTNTTNASMSSSSSTAANIAKLSRTFTARPSTSSSSASGPTGSFLRSLGANRRAPERLTEMDFPPLPEQPKVKSNKKTKSAIKESGETLSLEQLISTSLSLSNKNAKWNVGKKKAGSKVGASTKATKKPIKIQL